MKSEQVYKTIRAAMKKAQKQGIKICNESFGAPDLREACAISAFGMMNSCPKTQAGPYSSPSYDWRGFAAEKLGITNEQVDDLICGFDRSPGEANHPNGRFTRIGTKLANEFLAR